MASSITSLLPGRPRHETGSRDRERLGGFGAAAALPADRHRVIELAASGRAEVM